MPEFERGRAECRTLTLDDAVSIALELDLGRAARVALASAEKWRGPHTAEHDRVAALRGGREERFTLADEASRAHGAIEPERPLQLDVGLRSPAVLDEGFGSTQP